MCLFSNIDCQHFLDLGCTMLSYSNILIITFDNNLFSFCFLLYIVSKVSLIIGFSFVFYKNAALSCLLKFIFELFLYISFLQETAARPHKLRRAASSLWNSDSEEQGQNYCHFTELVHQFSTSHKHHTSWLWACYLMCWKVPVFLSVCVCVSSGGRTASLRARWVVLAETQEKASSTSLPYPPCEFMQHFYFTLVFTIVTFSLLLVKACGRNVTSDYRF